MYTNLTAITQFSLTDARLANLGGADLVGKWVVIYVAYQNYVIFKKILSYNNNTITFDSITDFPNYQ
jgi:hypothetical protein